MTKKVLVLGGYGNFGERICRALASDGDSDIYIAGRQWAKAQALAEELGAKAIVLDHQAPDFIKRLTTLKPHVLIHTSGPFQGQDYHIARACIDIGCHYMDIADGRNYVRDICQLDDAAKQANVLIISGASSLPALSSAVVDQYAAAFSRLDTIEHGISSGAKPPGMATMAGVMSYVGKPFQRWQNNDWQTVYGWQNVISHRYSAPVGLRFLSSCDVPDLDLFPQRYASVHTVQFRAGVGFATTSLATWSFSWLVRSGLLKSLVPYAPRLHKMATWIEPLGSVWSAMHVTLTGLDQQQQPLTKTWQLIAGNNHGPNIPCFPAIALTRKLLRNEMQERGAMPCMGLLTVDEILTAIPDLNLSWAAE
jgi:saccharopine dehydrogenase-like NADP-dependent oxidoreductase